jgi:hypothetical protein
MRKIKVPKGEDGSAKSDREEGAKGKKQRYEITIDRGQATERALGADWKDS